MKLVKYFMLLVPGILPSVLNAAVHLKIKNITDAKGKVSIGFFKSEDDFKNGKVCKGVIKNSRQNKMDFVFDDLSAGWYMIAIYQDINSNGRLDTNFIGIPVEPYGFSLNQMGLMGPSYEKSKFFYDGGDLFLEITLRNQGR